MSAFGKLGLGLGTRVQKLGKIDYSFFTNASCLL